MPALFVELFDGIITYLTLFTLDILIFDSEL